MKATGIVRKVDDLGRIVLPIELRRSLGIDVKDPIEIYVDEDTIILRKHDPARVLFATDTPWSDPAAEIAFVRSLGLSEEITDGILGGNAQRLIDSCR